MKNWHLWHFFAFVWHFFDQFWHFFDIFGWSQYSYDIFMPNIGCDSDHTRPGLWYVVVLFQGLAKYHRGCCDGFEKLIRNGVGLMKRELANVKTDSSGEMLEVKEYRKWFEHPVNVAWIAWIFFSLFTLSTSKSSNDYLEIVQWKFPKKEVWTGMLESCCRRTSKWLACRGWVDIKHPLIFFGDASGRFQFWCPKSVPGSTRHHQIPPVQQPELQNSSPSCFL